MTAVPSSAIMRRDGGGQLLDDDRREALERLVEQQQRRIGHQRARDRQHLLLAAGELVAHVAAPLGEAREQLVDRRQGPSGPGRDATVRFSSTLSEGKISRSCATQPMPARARRCGGGG